MDDNVSARNEARSPLASVVITGALKRRRSRQPDHAATREALALLTETLTRAPECILQEVAETALRLCRAHSTGINLEEGEGDQAVLRWYAVAGEFAGYLGSTMPRYFSPCGSALDAHTFQLMSYPYRYFGQTPPLKPEIVEMLIVPFSIQGKAGGTISAISHRKARRFDAEDRRVLNTLATFVATACPPSSWPAGVRKPPAGLTPANDQMVQSHLALQEEVRARERQNTALRMANASLEQFALAASHDLHEPLRTIRTYTELLQKVTQGKLDSGAAPLFGTILDTTLRMETLLDELMEYAQLGTKEGNTSVAPLRLSDPVADALGNLRALTEQHRVTVTEKDLPTVCANRMQLMLVFQNLVSNAIKFRREGEAPQIQISAKREADNWVISVRDNGQGFPPAAAKELFVFFKRLHGRDIPGNGIGLALCRKVVEWHGGTIWAESSPGEGSVFSFTLPVTARDSVSSA
jgi:signal transduction histidine kinase